MRLNNPFFFYTFVLFTCAMGMMGIPQHVQAGFDPFPVVELRSLDKITGRTSTFQTDVGATLQYGNIYIKVQACRKRPPIEQPESAAFLQVWEVTSSGKSEWIFSGWMFASSPALSALDHPIYDVWVLDCKESKNAATTDLSTSTEPSDIKPVLDDIVAEELPAE